MIPRNNMTVTDEKKMYLLTFVNQNRLHTIFEWMDDYSRETTNVGFTRAEIST
jgi:hypothetical protein